MHFSAHLDALLDIRDNARLAQAWTAQQTAESFADNIQLFYAVTRCLEIISEASRRLPKELRDRHSHLPWRAIMGAGNVYRHRYDNVAERLVWDAVQRDLPPVLVVIEIEVVRLSQNATNAESQGGGAS
jgi:uncharacterized protein with HEPN domain